MCSESAGHVYGKVSSPYQVLLGVGVVLLAAGFGILLLLILPWGFWTSEGAAYLFLLFLILAPLGAFFVYLAKSREIKRLVGSVEMSQEGIRNLGRSGSPPFPWQDFVDIKPRIVSQRLEIKSAKGVPKVIVNYDIEGFDELATTILSRCRHLSRINTMKFEGTFFRTMPPWLGLPLAILVVAAFLWLVEGDYDGIWTGLITVLILIPLQQKLTTPVKSISIGESSLSVGWFSKSKDIPFVGVSAISFVASPQSPFFQSPKLPQVMVSLEDGKTLDLVPPGSDPLEVFWCVDQAWEKFRSANQH